MKFFLQVGNLLKIKYFKPGACLKLARSSRNLHVMFLYQKSEQFFSEKHATSILKASKELPDIGVISQSMAIIKHE